MHAQTNQSQCRRLRGLQAGFTLVELMVVVAIIGILAGVATFMFSKSSNKAKANEVVAIFAEMRAKQEQFYLQNDTYVGAADETDMWPVSSSGPNRKNPIAPMHATWTQLRMAPSQDSVHCAYVTIAGDGGDDTNLGPEANNFGAVNAPAADWFYLLAECDWDGKGPPNSLYFTSSASTEILKQNEGK